jgi:DNA-directed RNA polymerase
MAKTPCLHTAKLNPEVFFATCARLIPKDVQLTVQQHYSALDESDLAILRAIRAAIPNANAMAPEAVLEFTLDAIRAHGAQQLITSEAKYKYLRDHWSSTACVAAGDWAIRVVTSLSCFDVDADGRFCTTPEWQPHIDNILEDLQRRHPVLLPHREEPKPITSWLTHHGERLCTQAVKDWRPETRAAFEATLETAKPPADPSGPFAELADARLSIPFQHVDGLNHLRAVPIRINQSLLPLVDKFAALMRPDVKKIVGGVMEMGPHGKKMRVGYDVMAGPDDKKLKADRKTVKADLHVARWCGNGPVYLDYACDRRGRVYAEHHLNYAREDHVRALFEFERGEPLGEDGMFWLEAHTANCFGGEDQLDKKPWDDRRRWVNTHMDMIERIAADPQGSFDDWRNADKKFAFIAACQELSRAKKDPQGFITHLPIGFDGTCNGIQHLALLSRDEEAGRLVNLTDTDKPQDIYEIVAKYIIQLLEDEDPRLRSNNKKINDAWCYRHWRERLAPLSDKQKRKLFKNPTMTFPYSATSEGRGGAIDDAYRDIFELNEPRAEARRFLARAVRIACEDKLKGPVRIMDYIRSLALHRHRQDKFLEWRSATGFPFVNMYHKPNVRTVDLGSGGVRAQYRVADGTLPETMDAKMLNAASPNFVHSLDAAHLIRTVLAANSEGIRDILTVHDSLACLAPHAQRIGKIIRTQLAMLYTAGDPLRALRDANVDDPNLFPLPPRGKLNPLDLQNAEYAFM